MLTASFTTELKAEDERIEVYNNGWKDGREDFKKQVIKLIMESYKKYWYLSDYFNELLNKINKI